MHICIKGLILEKWIPVGFKKNWNVAEFNGNVMAIQTGCQGNWCL
jgi:hypothetical protein